MSAHKHAESMRLYAEDAFQTTEPWVRWEFSEDGARWCQSTFDPTWSTVLQYRRKARTITVDGVELPAPETEAPAYGTKIYFINPFNRSVVESCWSGDATDTLTYLKNGQTFLHRDHAQQWADFIVSTMTRGREKGDE